MTPALVVPVLGRKLYPGASVALDFTRNLYRSGTPVVKGSPSLLSGWTFTRDSTGYAETAAGALTSFASGAPRITDKGLLVEEARTNLCLQSQALATTPWAVGINGTGITPTVTNNYAPAPDGTMTATRLQCSLGGGTTTGDNSYQAQFLTGTSCRASFWVKTTDGTSKVIYMRGANGFSTTVTGTWARYDFDAGTLAASTFAIGLRGGQTPTNSNTCDILVWGAQLEAGSFATSYIPTTTASATRAADVAKITGFSAPAAYTLAGEATMGSITPTTSALLSVSDNGGNNISKIYCYDGAPDFAGLQVRASAATQCDISGGSVSEGALLKVAGRVSANAFGVSRNGGAVVTDVAGSVPTTTQIDVAQVPGGQYLNAYLRRALIYPYAFTDAQLQTATA